MTTLIVRATDSCPYTGLFVNRCSIPSNERPPWANANSPHDYGNHEKLEGKKLPTVNPSRKPPPHQSLTATKQTHDTAKESLVCIELEDVRDEKHNSENDVDIVVQFLISCILKPTIKTPRDIAIARPCVPQKTRRLDHTVTLTVTRLAPVPNRATDIALLCTVYRTDRIYRTPYEELSFPHLN